MESISLSALIQAYANNELAADARYRDHPVAVSGIVVNGRRDVVGTPYVLLGATELSAADAVQCALADEAVAPASALRVGSAVNLQGRVDGRGITNRVELSACTLQP